MIPYLPTELLRAILTYLATSSDLVRCCSTSKTFLSIAQPLLYKDLEFKVCENATFDRSGDLSTRVHIQPKSQVLLATLKRTPRLRQFVQKVGLLGVIGALISLEEWKARTVDLEELVKEIVETFRSATLVNLDNVSLLGDVDEAVHRSQLQHSYSQLSTAGPSFSIVIPGSLGERTRFRGVYERFQWIPFSGAGNHIKVEELLGRSQHTLRRLSIPLVNSTSLALFQNLERLSLRLSVHSPSNVVSNLSSTISSLVHLRILIIHGSAREEDLETLLQSGIIARSLPSSLTHLALDYKLASDDLLAFLRDLPLTSNLKRFNCLSETGATEELRKVFSKRGIRLSFDEDWNI